MIDTADQQYCDAIAALGMQVVCTDTLMPERDDKVRLAEELLDFYQSANPDHQYSIAQNSGRSEQVCR